MTPEDIEAEYWAHYFDSKNSGEEFSDDEFSLEDELAKIDAEAEADEAATASQPTAPPAAPVQEPEPDPDPSSIDDWEEV